MPAKFNHTTRLAFRELLSKKLGDISNTYWSESELNGIINESLLTFGAVGHAWRDKVSLTIDSSKQFYDITTDLTINQELLEFSLTYQFLLDSINFILMEEISELNPTSEITNLDEILKFARNRINQYQLLTSLIISNKNYVMAASPINKREIDTESIDIVRVAFVDFTNSNRKTKLREDDEQSIANNSSLSFGTTTRVPKFYTSALGTLNQIFIYPPPANLGSLDVLSVNGISPSFEIELDSIIPLPNNLVPYIKFGILADIFSKDGLCNEPNIASYFEDRWNEGILIGQNYTSILFAALNERPIQLDSVVALDNYSTTFENNIRKPTVIGLAGYNLLTPNSKPDQLYSLDLDSVTNAYLPVNDTDFIDVKLEYIESLLNYCIHLASIKDGFANIKKTDSLKSSFLQTAVNNNLRLAKRGQSIETMLKKTKRQVESEPVSEKAA